MLATVNNHLADSLFCPVIPLSQWQEPGRHIQQAVRNVHRRWPELVDMVDTAVMLVEDNCIYEMTGEPALLALCRSVGTSQGYLVSLTVTGLSCTCGAWPPPSRVGPGDGLYCSDILAALLHVFLRRPLRPLPHSPEILWQEALDVLQHQMTKATFTNWLAGTTAVPETSSARLLTVEVRNWYAQEWLSHRLQPVIDRAVAGVTGYRLDVRFVFTPMRSDRLQNKEMFS